MKTSSIPNAGLGVFAKQFTPKGVRVGPYEGKIVPKDEMDSVKDTSYIWEVRSGHQFYNQMFIVLVMCVLYCNIMLMLLLCG